MSEIGDHVVAQSRNVFDGEPFVGQVDEHTETLLGDGRYVSTERDGKNYTVLMSSDDVHSITDPDEMLDYAFGMLISDEQRQKVLSASI